MRKWLANYSKDTEQSNVKQKSRTPTSPFIEEVSTLVSEPLDAISEDDQGQGTSYLSAIKPPKRESAPKLKSPELQAAWEVLNDTKRLPEAATKLLPQLWLQCVLLGNPLSESAQDRIKLLLIKRIGNLALRLNPMRDAPATVTRANDTSSSKALNKQWALQTAHAVLNEKMELKENDSFIFSKEIRNSYERHLNYIVKEIRVDGSPVTLSEDDYARYEGLLDERVWLDLCVMRGFPREEIDAKVGDFHQPLQKILKAATRPRVSDTGQADRRQALQIVSETDRASTVSDLAVRNPRRQLSGTAATGQQVTEAVETIKRLQSTFGKSFATYGWMQGDQYQRLIDSLQTLSKPPAQDSDQFSFNGIKFSVAEIKALLKPLIDNTADIRERHATAKQRQIGEPPTTEQLRLNAEFGQKALAELVGPVDDNIHLTLASIKQSISELLERSENSGLSGSPSADKTFQSTLKDAWEILSTPDLSKNTKIAQTLPMVWSYASRQQDSAVASRLKLTLIRELAFMARDARGINTTANSTPGRSLNEQDWEVRLINALVNQADVVPRLDPYRLQKPFIDNISEKVRQIHDSIRTQLQTAIRLQRSRNSTIEPKELEKINASYQSLFRQEVLLKVGICGGASAAQLQLHIDHVLANFDQEPTAYTPPNAQAADPDYSLKPKAPITLEQVVYAFNVQGAGALTGLKEDQRIELARMAVNIADGKDPQRTSMEDRMVAAEMAVHLLKPADEAQKRMPADTALVPHGTRLRFAKEILNYHLGKRMGDEVLNGGDYTKLINGLVLLAQVGPGEYRKDLLALINQVSANTQEIRDRMAANGAEYLGDGFYWTPQPKKTNSDGRQMNADFIVENMEKVSPRSLNSLRSTTSQIKGWIDKEIVKLDKQGDWDLRVQLGSRRLTLLGARTSLDTNNALKNSEVRRYLDAAWRYCDAQKDKELRSTLKFSLINALATLRQEKQLISWLVRLPETVMGNLPNGKQVDPYTPAKPFIKNIDAKVREISKALLKEHDALLVAQEPSKPNQIAQYFANELWMQLTVLGGVPKSTLKPYIDQFAKEVGASEDVEFEPQANADFALRVLGPISRRVFQEEITVPPPRVTVRQPADGQANQQGDQTVDRPVDQQGDQNVDQPVDQQGDQNVDQPVDQQGDQNVDQPVDQQGDQNVDQPVDQQGDQNVDQPVNQQGDQNVDQPVDQQGDQNVDRPVDQQADQNVDLVANQQADLEANQQRAALPQPEIQLAPLSDDQIRTQQVDRLREAINNVEPDNLDALKNAARRELVNELVFDGGTPLHYAVNRRKTEAVGALLEIPGVLANKQSTEGETVLNAAVRTRNAELVRQLLNAAAISPNAMDADGRTALHVAASLGDAEIVRMLVNDKRVKLNFQTPIEKKTALHIAISHGHREVVRLLANARNTKANIKDNQGFTAIDLAARSNDPKMMGAFSPTQLLGAFPKVVRSLFRTRASA
ncbi:MAG TPA: ankyrin repeat domain-containing protein [Burkholderiaceae bacterium]|nr:ankyrin repeat domain-containing protein [Burkholderiaceae bacterium]